MKQIAPKVKCRVIGGNSGPNSPNIGRIVVVLNAHPNPHPHSVWGQIWQCASTDGLPFMIKRDNSEEFGPGLPSQNIADFPEEFLEPLEDDALPPAQLQREKELTE